jgi:hypothetical protein
MPNTVGVTRKRNGEQWRVSVECVSELATVPLLREQWRSVDKFRRRLYWLGRLVEYACLSRILHTVSGYLPLSLS